MAGIRPPRPAGKAIRRFAPELTPHDLRYTWASWHYCLHRDRLRLRDDGGWETVRMVERYAKRVPDTYRDPIHAWCDGGAAKLAGAAKQGGIEVWEHASDTCFRIEGLIGAPGVEKENGKYSGKFSRY